MNYELNELAALSQALQQTLRRRGQRGARRLSPGPATPTPAPAAPQIETPPVGQKESPDPSQVPDPASAQPQTDELETQRQTAGGCLNLKQLHQAALECRACPLHKSREQLVFADGNAPAQGIFFVGDAPEKADDQTGIPFSGPAGQLLTDIIVKGMGLRRDQVSIANLVKCLPPGGRPPSEQEVTLCAPFLQRQIELINPRVLVPLGESAANFLLANKSGLAELRKQTFEAEGRRIIPTFHPSQLLLEPAKKRDCWSDIQQAMAAAGVKK